MSNAGHKIIEGLREAVAGNLVRIHMFGDDGERQTWVKETPLHRAALDLLEALRGFAVIVIPGDNPDYVPVAISVAVKAVQQARAAIAKAEGKPE